MDWQQITALVIVALTAIGFVATRWFPRRAKWARSTHCGCTASAIGQSGRILVRSRRGDVRQTIIHTP